MLIRRADGTPTAFWLRFPSAGAGANKRCAYGAGLKLAWATHFPLQCAKPGSFKGPGSFEGHQT